MLEAGAGPSLWNTIGLPIVVALVTTVAVEWLLRPRLDARKERIIGQLRDRDELLAQVLELTTQAEFLSLDEPIRPWNEELASLSDEHGRSYVRIEAITASLWGNITRHLALYPWRSVGVLRLYIIHARRVALSALPTASKARMLHQIGLPMIHLLRPKARWKFWWYRDPRVTRARLVRIITDQNAELAEAAPRDVEEP